MSPISDLLNMLPKSHLWPHAIRDAFYSKHMNNKERFKVTVFFLCNGVDPELIKNAYQQRFKFDYEAWRQIVWVIVVLRDSQQPIDSLR